jgi:hypothetical protein
MDEQLQQSATPPTDGPDEVAAAGTVDGIDPALMERARGLLEVPLADRAQAFDELNRDVVAALRAIEEL